MGKKYTNPLNYGIIKQSPKFLKKWIVKTKFLKKWIIKTKFHTGYINLFQREVESPVPSWFAVSLSPQPADGGFWAAC